MKKMIAMILALAMTLSMTACGSSAPAETKAPEAAGADTELKVAIIQQLDHSSLDEIREAIKSQLNTLAEPTNYTITIEEYNGQNDTSMLTQIATQVVADKVDMIIPIATLAAQYSALAAENTGIPVVYAAISDPEGAGLTGLSTVTGVSDALNTPFILDMMMAAQPDVKTVGLLYSTSEVNSEAPIAEAKAYLDAKGIAYLEKTGITSGEIVEAAASLVGRVEAVFTPTDNVVMAAEASVAELLNNAGIAHYTGADSFVQSGAFTTCGVNYTELGAKVGDMAFDILAGGAIGEFVVIDGGIITVNTNAAQACGIDYSVFNSMANTINAITVD